MKQRPSAIPSRCDILITIKLEINLSIINGLYPRFKTFLSEKIDKRFTLVPKKCVEYICFLSSRYTNVWVFVDVLVDDVIGECNFLEGLCTCDNYLASAENTASDLLHVFRRFELDFNSGVTIWFEGNFEDVVVLLEPISNLHEVDIVVEAEVGVDHDHTERINWNIYSQTQKSFENMNQLCDDALAIEEVTTTRHLD